MLTFEGDIFLWKAYSGIISTCVLCQRLLNSYTNLTNLQFKNKKNEGSEERREGRRFSTQKERSED